MNHNILAITCSTECASVACLHQGQITVANNQQDKQHSEVILDLIEKTFPNGLSMKDIDCIATDIGPGSFMGIRTAIATTQGLALAYHTPVYAINSLHLLALAASLSATSEQHHILTALDARRNQWYFACWQNTQIGSSQQSSHQPKIAHKQLQEIQSPTVGSADECLALSTIKPLLLHHEKKQKSLLFAGNVWEKIDNQAKHLQVKHRYPEATLLAKIAQQNPLLWRPIEQLEPLYVRNHVAY